MGFLDVLLGRPRAVRPDLDALFALPSAALALESALGLAPTGAGAVCFKEAEGASGSLEEIRALLRLDNALDVRVTRDEFGYTWTTCRQSTVDVPALLTSLHAVNSTLTDAGFGSMLLCTVVGFGDAERRLGVVYLAKRGTFYPFAPLDGSRRDSVLELRAKWLLARELPVEPDLDRWFPIWNAPVP